MEHKGTKIIETGRLTLRPVREADAEAGYRNWCGDSRVTEFLMWPTHENSGVTRQVFRSWENSYADPAFYQWAIVPKELGEPIGTISVVHTVPGIEMMSMGYCIGCRWWHRGITCEALAAVIDFLFGEVGVNRIEARHDPANPHSGDVMRKCGMTCEGTLRQAALSNRGVTDVCVYSILRSEWKDRKRSNL